jgi:hypothetical protein
MKIKEKIIIGLLVYITIITSLVGVKTKYSLKEISRRQGVMAKMIIQYNDIEQEGELKWK